MTGLITLGLTSMAAGPPLPRYTLPAEPTSSAFHLAAERHHDRSSSQLQGPQQLAALDQELTSRQPSQDINMSLKDSLSVCECEIVCALLLQARIDCTENGDGYGCLGCCR